MKRIAILGGGIAGVSAAYEVSRQHTAGVPVECVLFEATHRLGGIVETERRDGFLMECGPDSWVTDKREARELATELSLESEIVFSQDERRKTYLAEGRTLHALPDGMRMMVPTQWTSMLSSPLFTWQAKLAYLREPKLAEQLKATALDFDRSSDESVRDFVLRHFGAEVADTIAAPLLAGVFGGDIAVLSARAVLPAYVALEREHGSLIEGLRQRARDLESTLPVFTTLRSGIDGLIEGMASHIPMKNIRFGASVDAIERNGDKWRVHSAQENANEQLIEASFDAVLVATPAKTTSRLLHSLDASMSELLPRHSSSAIVVNLGFTPEQAASMQIPRGFGFLVPKRGQTQPGQDETSEPDWESLARRALLACTFVDQKFPHRAPAGARLLRAFFGGPDIEQMLGRDDSALHTLAQSALGGILGQLPDTVLSVVRRLPDSLPLYFVGHLERIAKLESRAARFPHLRLIGNSYRGVGLPDLIRSGRNAARETVANLGVSTGS